MAADVLVLGEDRHRIYLVKPEGLPVFPPHREPDGDCLWRRLVARDPARATGWPDAFLGGIAHRLDTGTSGLVIVARTPADLEALRGAFASGALRKHYVLRSGGSALSVGASVVLERPLAHHARRGDRMVVARESGHPGRHRGRWYAAWTRLTRLDAPMGDGGTGSFHAEIRTGVTHQIRAHAAALGVPVLGDAIYGGAPSERLWLHHVRVDAPGWASPECPAPWWPRVVA